ncbi:type II toxin-antitoxin system RelB/DinJ family antitoxin [Campylobacter sp. FMV-PI01]|uniref:Type II toxin-antitoxin system RelB/DinJ family antitoxin n=1 Tax=Campylobacter portucalensis TaxID=2608384 RepID=A0A6L5WKQ1_9BACT|nr:type II toxin-antitoxin system RelB/DinJ family antitoxin [Campylobacter portucalensis]MSN96423.1 type II toxin-antitoxin system RelB/DinJ family antitoxin [Campylobacter portucalensis]
MTTVTIRVSDYDKKKVEQIFSDLGLNISSATNTFFKQVIYNKGISFELKVDPFYSKENLKRLEKNAKEMKETGGKIKDIF